MRCFIVREEQELTEFHMEWQLGHQDIVVVREVDHRGAEGEVILSSRSYGSPYWSSGMVPMPYQRATFLRSRAARQPGMLRPRDARSSGSAASLEGSGHRQARTAMAMERSQCKYCRQISHWQDECPLQNRGTLRAPPVWHANIERRRHSLGVDASRRFQVMPDLRKQHFAQPPAMWAASRRGSIGYLLSTSLCRTR